MNIFFISHLSNVGGAELTLLDIAIDLKKLGHNVTVGIPDLKGDLNKYLDEYGIAYIKTNLPIFRSSDNNLDIKSFTRKLRIVKKKIMKNRSNLILTNTSTIPWGAILSKDLQIPHAWLIRESNPNDHDLHISEKEICSPTYILRNSQRVYVPSRKAAIEWFGESFEQEKKITVMYTQPLRERIMSLKVEKKNFHKEQLNVCIVSSLESYKNLKFLFLLIEKWHENDYRLIIYGNGSMRNQLIDKINKSKSKHKISVMEHTQQIGFIYNSVDIVLSINTKEAFGRTLSEGAYFGCIPMFPRKSSFSERFTHNLTGIAFEDDSAESLFSQLNGMYRERNLLEKISINARLFANSGFGVKSPAKLIEQDFL